VVGDRTAPIVYYDARIKRSALNAVRFIGAVSRERRTRTTTRKSLNRYGVSRPTFHKSYRSFRVLIETFAGSVVHPIFVLRIVRVRNSLLAFRNHCRVQSSAVSSFIICPQINTYACLKRNSGVFTRNVIFFRTLELKLKRPVGNTNFAGA